jgi:Xaa-Pro dipeptidase
MDRRKFLKAGSAAAALAGVSSSFASVSSNALIANGHIPATVIKAIKDRIRPITKEERLKRLEQAQKLMAENQIDALLMEGGTSLNYFTGIHWGRSERLFAMLLPKKGEPLYIAPKFEESRAREQTGNAKVYTWEEHESPFDLVKQMLKDAGTTTGNLAFEETTRFFVTDNIQKANPGISIKSGTAVTAGCRAVKSAHELELMQIANDMAREVFQASLRLLKEGMTEGEFGNVISGLFAEFGCNGGALVLFGEASAHPHGLVQEVKLKQNDIVLIDGGCSVEGYQSDITRTTMFGKPTQKMNDVWNIVRKAQDAGLKAAKPGVSAESVDAAARKVIIDSGYGPATKYFTHRLGHGIGMDGHEWYYLVGGNSRLLEAGNMFSNEPGIYIPGEFGIRLEDELLITPGGAKLLLPQAESLMKIF